MERLERRIVCMENDEPGILERAVGNTLGSLNNFDAFFDNNPTISIARQRSRKFLNTLYGSTSVLLRKLDRVSSGDGASNRDYTSLTDFVVQETAAGVRIIGNLLSNPSTLAQLVDPDTPTLVPHVPAMRVYRPASLLVFFVFGGLVGARLTHNRRCSRLCPNTD